MTPPHTLFSLCTGPMGAVRWGHTQCLASTSPRSAHLSHPRMQKSQPRPQVGPALTWLPATL